MHDVTEALGESIPPLTGGFDNLARAMAPQTIEAFGGAMDLVNGKTGLFGQAVTKVVPLLDNWIARIDLWGVAQGETGKILSSGVGYLTQFADIIGNVVSAIGNLLSKDPQIAHFVLDLVNGLALLIKGFSDLPAPVVEAVLALHGIYVWGGLMATVIPIVLTYLTRMVASFVLLTTTPLGWFTIAAAAIAVLAYDSVQATPAVKNLISTINTGLANDSASQAITDITAGIGQLNTQLKSITTASLLPQMSGQIGNFTGNIKIAGYYLSGVATNFGDFAKTVPESLESWSNLGKAATSLGHAVASIFMGSNTAASTAQANDIKAIGAAINGLLGSQANLFRETGNLITQGSSYTQALALMDLAGVKASDSFAVMQQKVDNLILGYQDMSVQGGILNNTVNAVSYASLQQQSDITQLTGAWTTFITMVDGGLNTFVAFQQQVNTTSQDITGITPAASSAGGAVGGLSAASLQASGAFVQGVNNANSLINALTLQASAAGLGAKGTDMLTAAVKDTVAQMIPLAGNSTAAQASLIALAQQGGAPAGISFQQLQKWVSTASGSMADASKSGGPAVQLQSVMSTLATKSDNLTTDVQNLSIALGTTLSGAMASALVAASGGQQLFTNLAKAVLQTGTNSASTTAAAAALGGQLLAITGNAQEAYQQFYAFAVGALHLTATQAQDLWKNITGTGIPALAAGGASAETAKQKFIDWAENGLNYSQSHAADLYKEVSGTLIPSLNNLGTNSVEPVKAKFIDWAENGLDLSKTAANNLWVTLRNQYLDTVGVKADESKAQFETLAGQLGLTKGQADNLWASLRNLAGGSPYTAKVNFVGSGSGSIAYNESIPGVTAGPSSTGILGFHAAGTLITAGTTPTADDVIVAVSKGETIVSAQDSRVLAPAFRAVGVPGYAAGGTISGVSDLNSVMAGGLPYMANTEIAFGKAVEAAFAAAVIAQFKAAVNSASGGGGIVSFAESFLGKIPYVWGGTSLGPAGADCSGFVQSVYGHFGIGAPRTSEAQGAWVRRAGPTAGGLAFYHSPPGGPDPGHVAIVADAGSVISQGGGLGPTMESLGFLPLLWTGVPPGGFPGGAGGASPGGSGTGGTMTASAIAALWDQLGGNSNAAGNMARIAFAESGDNPSAVQAGEPPGLTGWGLYQITPTSGISQDGAFGNLLNASNNTRAAISLFNASGYQPWASDPVGASLTAAGLSYACGGLIQGMAAAAWPG